MKNIKKEEECKNFSKIAEEIQEKWNCSGLAGTMYEDYAWEIHIKASERLEELKELVNHGVRRQAELQAQLNEAVELLEENKHLVQYSEPNRYKEIENFLTKLKEQ